MTHMGSLKPTRSSVARLRSVLIGPWAVLVHPLSTVVVLPMVRHSRNGDVTMDTSGRKWFKAAAIALLMLAASCTSSSPSVEPSTSVSVQESPPATDPEPGTTTTSEPATDPAVDEMAADLESAFATQFVAWRSCTADYDACDPDAAFESVYGGQELENLAAVVRERQGFGRKNTVLEPDLDFQRIDLLTFTNDQQTAATIEYCSVDSRLVSVVNAAGEDEVFDETVVHESGLAFYELGSDGTWRLIEFDVVLRSSEDPLCDG